MGVVAEIRNQWIKRVHMFVAITGIALAELAVIIDYGMWWLVLSNLVLGLVLYIVVKKYIIWAIEIMAFATICIALFTKL